MSNSVIQAFTGPKEVWDEVFDIVQLYLTRPNITEAERKRLAEGLKKIKPLDEGMIQTVEKYNTPPPPAPADPPLTFRDIRIGDLVQYRGNQKYVANCRARVEKKGRTKVVVVLLDDAQNDWKAGTRLRSDPTSFVRWKGGQP